MMGNVFGTIARRRTPFLLGGAVVLCAVCAAAPFVLEPEYTATALAHTRVGSGEAETGADLITLADRDAVTRAAADVGLLPTVLQRTADGRDPLEEILRNLRIEPRGGAAGDAMVAVSFTHADPHLAAALPNTLTEKHLQHVVRSRDKRLTVRRDAARKRVAEADEELETLTKRQVAFEAEHADLLPDRPGAIHEKIADLRTKIDELESRRVAARQQLARLHSLLAKPKPAEGPRQVVKGPNPNLRYLQDQLREARAELDEALELRNMTEIHPTIQKLRKKIDVLEKQIEQTPDETVVQRVYGPEEPDPSVALQIAAAQAEVDEATLQIQRLESDLAEARRARIGFGPAREQYLALLKQIETQDQELKQATDQLAGAEANLQVAQARQATAGAAFRPAEPPALPSFPPLWYVLGGILAASLAAGAGAAAIAQWSDCRITTPEDAAKRFGVPVLGTISEIAGWPRRVARCVGRWLLRPVLWLVVLTVVAMAVSNVVLWLRHPEAYQEWKEHPSAYVYERLADWSDAADWQEW